jgi:trimeric autotransporter adhesin
MAYQPKSYRKFVATAATATLVASAVTPAAAASFTDVSDRYKEAVDYLVEKGVTNGVSETSFGTSQEIKRADAAVMIAKLLGLDTGNAPDAGFTDVPERARGAVNALKAAGIINGKTATTFGAEDPMTRAEMAKVIANAYKLTGEDVELPFTDVSKTFEPYVKALYKHGITTGKNATQFGSNDKVTRGEFALFTHRTETLEPATPEVVSVNAINAKQVIVKFNKEVDVNSAQTTTNYTFSDANTVVSATVLEDGKSVKLTLNNAYTTATNVAVTVQGVALKSDVNQTFPLFSAAIKVEDTVKAEITKVEAITNGSTATSATIYFSEPVKEGIVKINGQAVATIISTVETLTVNNLSLDASKTHKVEIVNLKDTANNVNALATTEFTVTKDANAPTVASVQAYGDYKILVTFNKKINASTVTSTDVSVKDELLNDVSVGGFDALNGDTTGTKFVITLDKTKPEVSGLYTNKNTRNLTIVFADKSIDDTLGNQLAATTRTVTLSKDVTAPSVTGITFEKDATTKQVTKLKVTFDEEIDNLDLSKFTIVDANGVLKNSILNNATVTISGKEAIIDITDVTLTGNYSFQIASGAASDLALTPNKSKAFAGTVNFGAAETVGSFDFVDGDNDPTNGEVTEANNIITVTFPEAVKGGAVTGSATDVNNYSINGKPLPAGTTITLDSTQTVATITLPSESIAVSDSAAVFTINNVQSLTNKTIKPVTTTVQIVDNVSPVLQSARVLDNNTIELTYSENLANISGALVGEEFVIYEGTTAKTLADADVLATRVAGYNNKIVIDLQGSNILDLTKEISIKALVPATGADIVDESGNTQKADVKIVVSK